MVPDQQRKWKSNEFEWKNFLQIECLKKRAFWIKKIDQKFIRNFLLESFPIRKSSIRSFPIRNFPIKKSPIRKFRIWKSPILNFLMKARRRSVSENFGDTKSLRPEIACEIQILNAARSESKPLMD